MPGLYPHPSASAESFKIGDQVRWYVSEREISPYIGKVTQVCPGINKVWVEFPIGGNQQKDPTELVVIPHYVGISPVEEDTGYDDYAKRISEKTYGTLEENTLRMAQKLLSKQKKKKASENNSILKMASKIAGEFATQVVDKLAIDVISCVDANLNDVQAYQKLYPKYGSICSDGFVRTAIQKIYEVKNGSRA
jgi:hypothetical protein